MAEWLPVRLYRFRHDHGGAKDWAVAHDSQTVRELLAGKGTPDDDWFF